MTAYSAIAALLGPGIVDEPADAPVRPRTEHWALHLAYVTLVNQKIFREEIAQLVYHLMIIENFRYSGVIFGSEIGRSIQLSAWHRWGDADVSHGCCPFLRQLVISSNIVKLCHVDITTIDARARRVNPWNSGKFDKRETVGDDVLTQGVVRILYRPEEELRDSRFVSHRVV